MKILSLIFSFGLCCPLCADVAATIDLKGSDTIEVLSESIQLSHDITVTCIGQDAKAGYVVAKKLFYIGVRNYLYLKNSEDDPPKESDVYGLKVVTVVNYKAGSRLEEEISGYNAVMVLDALVKQEAEASAGQPATASESKPTGGQKPHSESKPASR